ncbi:MAG: hypothetical protein ACUVWX_00600 [Kiritimatiellia bacterium]
MKQETNARAELTQWGKAALKACDWFCRSQTVQKQPNWDANNGRFLYNYYLPTRRATWGIGWTQARAVMCLLTAWERTGEEKYVETARRGITYAKLLQNMDRRFPLTYGAFHEETPQSDFSYPRDATEVADALLQWYAVTGDEDALYRAELFFRWFEREAVTVYEGFGWWVARKIAFDGTPEDPHGTPAACEAGCGTVLAPAYWVTRKDKYKRLVLRIADQICRYYCPNDIGPLLVPATIRERARHHSASDGTLYNDDGAAVSLLNAYKLTGNARYLEAARRVADYFNGLKTPIPIYSGTGSVANFLLEMDRVLNETRYRARAEQLARQMLTWQVRRGPPEAVGAFRGEDEGGGGYYGGNEFDYVTTRMTAYATLTLFKLDGQVWPRGYAAGWRA